MPHLGQPAAFHPDLLVLLEIGHQPVQCPTCKGLVKRRRWGEAGGDHGANLLGGVGWWASDARGIAHPGEALGVELRDPAAHRLLIAPGAHDDLADTVAFMGEPTDACPIPQARFPFLAVGQDTEISGFLGGEGAKQ